MDRMSGGYPPPPGGPPAFPPPPDQQPPGFPPAPQSGPPGAGPQGFPPPSNPYGYQPPYGYPARPPGHYPLDLGRVLELTFSIFRYRWRTFVAIALVIMLPAWALLSIGTAVLYTNSDWYMDWTADMANYFRTGEFANPLPDLWPSFLANLAISVIVGIATSIAIGALTDVAAATYSGAPASAGASARRSLGRWRTYIGLYLMTTAITFVVVFLGVLVGLALFFATSSGGSIQPGPLVFFALIVFVATFAALVFILIRFAFSVPVVMLESSGAVDALRRSWRLVSGSSWRVLGYLIVFGLLVGIVSALLATLVNIVINPVRMTSLTVITLDPARFAISTFVQGLITSVLMPLPAIGMMLLYFDLRWRRGEPVPHGGSQPAEGAPVQPSAQPPYPPPPPG